jgi:hypothetical protein
MTIDERLERLTERHEALVQTVELTGHQIRDLIAASNEGSKNIRALARTAGIQDEAP